MAGEDRGDELRDVAAVVLVVCVGVDDHVRAELQAGIEPGLEREREPLVVRQPDDVVDPVLARDLNRAVGRAVVDDQPLDGVEPWDRARQRGERHRELGFLVETGNLDDELHDGHGTACVALVAHTVAGYSSLDERCGDACKARSARGADRTARSTARPPWTRWSSPPRADRTLRS